MLRPLFATATAVGALLLAPGSVKIASATCPPQFLPTTIGPDADCIFRDYTTDGVPSTGFNPPYKPDIRHWGEVIGANIRSPPTNIPAGYCLIGDGSSHPLSSVSACGGVNTTGFTLSQWQTLLPAATSLSDEVDWAAVQSYLNAATASVEIQVNNGSTLVSNQRVTAPSAYTTSFVGAGPFQSAFLFNNATAGAQGIYMAPINEGVRLTVDGLSIETNVDQPSGMAISYELATANEQLGLQIPLRVNNVFIGGTSKYFPFSFYWNTPIDAENANFSEISNFFIVGNATNSTANTNITTSNMLYAIHIHTPLGSAGLPSSDAVKIHDGLIYVSQTGIQIDGDAEQDRINKVDIVSVNSGVVQSNGEGATCGYITDSHINTFVVAVSETNCYTGINRGNLIFLNPPAGGQATGFALSNAKAITTTDNQIDNVSSASGSVAIGYNVDNASFNNTFAINHCINLTYCVDSNGSTYTTNPGGPNFFTSDIVISNPSAPTLAFDASIATNSIYEGNNNLLPADYYPLLPANNATPNINFPASLINTANTATTNITSFPNAVFGGPEVTIRCGDANTTFVNGALLVTPTGANVACVSGVSHRFKPLGNGGVTIMEN